jgi:hypothetical protein
MYFFARLYAQIELRGTSTLVGNGEAPVPFLTIASCRASTERIEAATV